MRVLHFRFTFYVFGLCGEDAEIKIEGARCRVQFRVDPLPLHLAQVPFSGDCPRFGANVDALHFIFTFCMLGLEGVQEIEGLRDEVRESKSDRVGECVSVLAKHRERANESASDDHGERLR